MEPFRSVYFGAIWTASESTMMRLMERNDTDCSICYMSFRGVKNFGPLLVAPSVEMPAHPGNGNPMPRSSRNLQIATVSDEEEGENWRRTALTTHCGHTFCRACIVNWMVTCCNAKPKKWTIPCPLCRTGIIQTATFHFRYAVRLGLIFFDKAMETHRRPLCARKSIEELRETKENIIITTEDRHRRYVSFDREWFTAVNWLALGYMRHLREVAHDFDNDTFCPKAFKEPLTAWLCVYPQVLEWVEVTLVRPCPFEPKNSLVRMDALFNTIKSCVAMTLFCKRIVNGWEFSVDDCKYMSRRDYQEFAHSLQQKKEWRDFVIWFQVTIGLLKTRDDTEWSQISDDMIVETFETVYPEA